MVLSSGLDALRQTPKCFDCCAGLSCTGTQRSICRRQSKVTPDIKTLVIRAHPLRGPSSGHQRLPRCLGLPRLKVVSPSNLGKETVRPRAYAVLSRLAENQRAEAERCWEKPVLDGHLAGINSVLRGRNVAEDEDYNDGEQHAREQEPVLRQHATVNDDFEQSTCVALLKIGGS